MATVSTRLDDEIKSQAEKIANEIGMSLSTVINVFLKKFVSVHGFPFDIVAPSNSSVYDRETLDDIVKRAISDTSNPGIPDQFTYLDHQGKLTTIHREE